MLRTLTWVVAAIAAMSIGTKTWAEPVAVVGGTLIDGSGGRPVSDTVVVMDKGRFVAVGPRGKVLIPQGATIIDANGKYVLPGLMNANVHLIDGVALMGSGGNVAAIEYLVRYEDKFPEVIEEGAQIALKNGMTTLFDTWNAFGPAKVARDRIARGEVPGARLFVAGNIVGMSGPYTADFCAACAKTVTPVLRDRINKAFEAGVGKELGSMSIPQLRVAIRDYIAKKPDFVKVAVSDHLVTSPGPYLNFTKAGLQAISDEVRAAGLGFQTHTTTYESFHMAIDLNVDLMQHCTSLKNYTDPIPAELIAKMKKNSVWCEVQPQTARWAENNGRKASFDHIKQLIDAKAPIVLGTDAGVTDPDMMASMSDAFKLDRPWELGNDHFLWFEAMAEKGMAPMDMILAATSNIAKAYKKPELGMIAKGKVADVVILDRNPLENISNMRSISAVIKDGKLVDRDALPGIGLVSSRKAVDHTAR